ncbi:MAG: bifunctional glutamate N-acetyltransferase/amino-acid acetyltransferase ArgJ [Candidatus Nanopelagicales bacterium]
MSEIEIVTGPDSGGVTAAAGFRAAGLVAGIKSSGAKDLAVVVNDGPSRAAAAVFTTNRVKAAPVLWSQECAKSGRFAAVVLNSGGANACTGPGGFADTHRTAEHAAALLGVAPIEVAVASTGLIGERLPMIALLSGLESAIATLDPNGGADAATAIMTTDSVAKLAVHRAPAGWTIGGMAKGAGMLAPGLATMLVVITTDADPSSLHLDEALSQATTVTFDRLDSDGCMSTNDMVLLMASGASEVAPTSEEFSAGLTAVCASLARQLIADAEGATKDLRISVIKAANSDDAVTAGRAVARSNLFKCAVHGQDPNWGRILAALGTTEAKFEPDAVDVSINGVLVCRDGCGHGDRSLVDMSGREVVVTIDLRSGEAAATIWTNDLTAMYVHENSAYST